MVYIYIRFQIIFDLFQTLVNFKSIDKQTCNKQSLRVKKSQNFDVSPALYKGNVEIDRSVNI